MCGIVGEIRFDRNPPSLSFIKGALKKLEPRGPDAEGKYVHENVAFGHRRLKIIDLSDDAAQPMVDENLGLVIVFNGCVYNYPELREELKQKGYKFFAHSDTEVVLKAFHAWGPECVERFNGMFAFAIYEPERGKIFCARDRLGIKPFYFQNDGKKFRFASTLPALLDGEKTPQVDPAALNFYMSFHAVIPAPHTLFKGYQKLEPGSWMLLERDGSIKTKKFWELTFDHEGKENISEADWIDRLEASLRAAVKRRLVADVSVGVLLSGGLDSSLIVALLKEAGQKHLKTFSIGFDDAGGEEGNEFKYSDIIARQFATEHTRIHAEHAMVLENLKDCIRAMSEPMVSHDVIGFYLLSREVSKHVKVVQSGQGADEVFAGYHWYPKLQQAGRKKAFDVYREVFFDRDFEDYQAAVDPGMVKQDFASAFVKADFEKSGAAEAIDKGLRLDTTIMLVDDPVKRVDNMTMNFGLEARVPFLDHELVELAAQMPGEIKTRGEGKHVLKEMARRHLPGAVIDRPKGYFPVPALKHIEGEYKTLVQDVLYSRKAKERGLFRPEYVRELMDAPRGFITPLGGSKLWQLALLELWLQEQGL